MNPKRRDHLLRFVLLLLGLCTLILAVRSRDRVLPTKDAEQRPERSHSARKSSGQSIWEASRAQQPPLDWKHLCEIADEESGRNWEGWDTRQTRYSRGLVKFTVDELLELLAEIPNLTCSETAAFLITNIILEAIIEKQPSIGFSLTLDRYQQNPDYGYIMSGWFREWVAKDDQAAELWLLQQDWSRAAEAPQSPFVDMGSALVSRHLNQNMDQAAVLIHRLPMAGRFKILQYGFNNCDRTFDDARAAAFIRQSLNHHEQPRMFGEVYAHLALDGDYQKIDRVIQTISASEEERNEIVVTASRRRMNMGTGKPPQESLDEIRGWVAEQSPAVLDRTTGEILSVMYERDLNHQAAEDFVLLYHDAGASDGIITAFLESSESTKTPETIKRLEAHLRAEPGGDGE